VSSRLANAIDVFVPIVVTGELFFGARKSARVPENVLRITQFAAANSILPCDLGTAIAYGEIKGELRSKGRPIPENDVWIAAIARQHGLTLASRDSHFKDVDGLTVEPWDSPP
jgi:tRNA(fMet)-specific endonuclease VapC